LVTLPQLIHDNWAGILHSVSRLAASFVDRDMKRDYTLIEAAKLSLYIPRSCLLCRQAAADAVCLAFGRLAQVLLSSIFVRFRKISRQAIAR